MEDMVNIAEALAHTEGADVPEVQYEDPPEKHEGRERVRLRRHEMAERRMQMAAMFAKGKYAETIAKKFGVSRQTVTEEIGKLVREYQTAAQESISKRIAEEEALIYMVQLEATQAWFESKEGKVVNSAKRVREIKSIGQRMTGPGRKGKQIGPRELRSRIMQELDEAFGVEAPSEEDEAGVQTLEMVDDSTKYDSGERTESSAGDPAFLRIILECSDRRARLYGYYPSTDGRGGIRGLGDEELETMTPAQRMTRLRSMLDRARQQKAQQLALNEASVSELNHQPVVQSAESIFAARAKQITQQPKVIDVPTAETDEAWDATA